MQARLKTTADSQVFLITGGAGSLGRRLAEYILKISTAQTVVRILDHNENGLARLKQSSNHERLRFFIGDVRDKNRVIRAMEGVDVCFHCAALKHVDLCEYNPFESVLTNVMGTQNCLEAALECEIDNFLFISSDKAVQAVSTYGRCKALSESLTLDAQNYKGDRKTRFAVARPPNYIDSDGSIFDLWKFQKEQGLPITVTDIRMERYFMGFDQINSFLLKCVQLMNGGEIFVPLGAEKCKIVDLARQYSGSLDNIKYIGMRPGEKLEEAIIDPSEAVRAEIMEGMYVIRH